VAADQTIGLVEVMKQYAEIKAGVDGRVVSFEVDSEAIIGPGDVVAVIETSA
jgi:biotin carboxyl carrier protein